MYDRVAEQKTLVPKRVTPAHRWAFGCLAGAASLFPYLYVLVVAIADPNGIRGFQTISDFWKTARLLGYHPTTVAVCSWSVMVACFAICKVSRAILLLSGTGLALHAYGENLDGTTHLWVNTLGLVLIGLGVLRAYREEITANVLLSSHEKRDPADVLRGRMLIPASAFLVVGFVCFLCAMVNTYVLHSWAVSFPTYFCEYMLIFVYTHAAYEMCSAAREQVRLDSQI